MNKRAMIVTDAITANLQADTLASDDSFLYVYRTHEDGGKVTEELIGLYRLTEVKTAYITEQKNGGSRK